MKRKTDDGLAFNPVSFNVGLARQVLQRRRPAEGDQEPPAAGAEVPTAEPEGVPTTAHSEDGGAAAADEPTPAPADKPKPRPKKRKPRPAPPPPPPEVHPTHTFRGGMRQDLRVPLDEQRRDDLGDLVRQLNRRLRSRLPEAVTFRALLTVMLAAREQILGSAAGSALNRTPPRQDVRAGVEAERDVALLLADALANVDAVELARAYADQLAALDDVPAKRAA